MPSTALLLKLFPPTGRRWSWIVACCLAWIVNGDAQAQVELRILTYNIHHGEGVDGKLDLPRIARVIRASRADLVALQEVDRGTARARGVDQMTRLAELTEMRAAFGRNITFQGGGYGNAVLSRFPIISSSNHLLPNVDDGEQRGVLEVALEIPDLSEPLVLLATHLDHRRDDEERRASAAFLDRLTEEINAPAVLAGDLNDVPASPTLRRLRRRWLVPGDRPLPTVPVTEPIRQIDFVLLHPGDRWEVIEIEVLPEAVASDHRAVLLVCRLNPAS